MGGRSTAGNGNDESVFDPAECRRHDAGMSFSPLPSSAAWRHLDARSGFEVVFSHLDGDGLVLTGCTTAAEDDQAWIVDYLIRLDTSWRTRNAKVRGRSDGGEHAVVVDTDGVGHWRVDGQPAPHLDGCFDVDLESSGLTNAFPVHRLGLDVGGRAMAPAAYVRARLTCASSAWSRTTPESMTTVSTSGTATRLLLSTSRATSCTTTPGLCWTIPESLTAPSDAVRSAHQPGPSGFVPPTASCRGRALMGWLGTRNRHAWRLGHVRGRARETLSRRARRGWSRVRHWSGSCVFE